MNRLPILVVLVSACLYAQKPAANSPIGTWRGDSICTSGAASCHDEKLVCYIEPIAGNPDAMRFRADKIVDGKVVPMGDGPWKYDRTKNTLSMEIPRGLWLVTVNGGRIEGTLTVENNVVFRRMTLIRDDPK
jgi:hypothetical protein